jgi:dinuclear metal center YbgI/SA1388 family protein
MILVNNINLFSYHLPLDVHAHYGNNIQLSQLLGLTYIKEIELQDCVTAVMCSGSSIDNCIYKLIEKIAFVLQRQPLVIHGGSKNCHKIGICTGAAQNFIDQISESGCDTYISGEVSERTYHLAKELGINYIAAGHHATERYGVWSLGNHLREKFSLNHYFIDIDNPI